MQLIQAAFNKQFTLVLVGSVATNMSIPESDIDLVLRNSDGVTDACLYSSLLAKLMSIMNGEDGLQKSLESLQFVNGRTKLIQCTIKNISVDITVNQSSAVVAAEFLNDVDAIIGRNGLFSKSVRLIKVRTGLFFRGASSCFRSVGVIMKA